MVKFLSAWAELKFLVMRNRLIPVLLGAALIAGCANGGGKKEEGRAPVRVKVEAVKAAESSSVKTYVGRAEASKSAVLFSPFPARLEKIDAKEGRAVRAGGQIARVHSETVESSLSAAEATLRQAQDGYDRLQAVKDNGSVPSVKVVEVETDLSRAQAAFRTARKAADDCSVKAPFDGTVSEIFAEEGEELTLGQPIAKIVDLNSLEISISVPETEIASCSVGGAAEVTVKALSDKTVRARVVRKGVDASPVSHSYICALKPDTPLKGLMPGMICKVVFRSASKTSLPEAPESEPSISGAPVIPASVIRTDKTGRYVWTVGEGNIVEKKYVTVGDFSGKGVKILSGLSEGDLLIVAGASKVSCGTRVEAVSE